MCGETTWAAHREDRQWHINWHWWPSMQQYIILSVTRRHYSAARIRQHIYRLILEQNFRDSVPQNEQHCKGPKAVVHAPQP